MSERGHGNEAASAKDYVPVELVGYDGDVQVPCSFSNLPRTRLRDSSPKNKTAEGVKASGGGESYLLEMGGGVDGAAGVVGIDDDQPSGGGVSWGPQLLQVGLPAAAGHQVVEPDLDAGEIP